MGRIPEEQHVHVRRHPAGEACLLTGPSPAPPPLGLLRNGRSVPLFMLLGKSCEMMERLTLPNSRAISSNKGSNRQEEYPLQVKKAFHNL